MLPPKTYQKAKTLVLTAGVVTLGALATVVIGYVMASPTFGWTGELAFLVCSGGPLQSVALPPGIAGSMRAVA